MDIIMKTASEIMKEDSDRPKLSTGSVELDRLIDGIQMGQFYLFYGEDNNVLDLIIHRVLVNSILPIEKRGFNAQALYFNACNYHQGKTMLNPSHLAGIAKDVGLDPKTVFKNIYSICAFNEMQQIASAKEIVDMISHNPNIRLLVIHNLTRFVETSKKPLKALQTLKDVVNRLKQVTFENDVALLATCPSSKPRNRMPKPKGGNFLHHTSNVIIFLKLERGAFPTIKAYLAKHPYGKTQSITLHAFLGGTDPCQSFQGKVEELRHFQNALLDSDHKKAFDSLIREAWTAEGHALSNSNVPCVLDIMNLMANIHNKKCVEANKKKLDDIEKKLCATNANSK